MLGRQHRRPSFRAADRAFLAALVLAWSPARARRAVDFLRRLTVREDSPCRPRHGERPLHERAVVGKGVGECRSEALLTTCVGVRNVQSAVASLSIRPPPRQAGVGEEPAERLPDPTQEPVDRGCERRKPEDACDPSQPPGGRQVREHPDPCRALHHPHPARLDQLPRLTHLVRRDPRHVGRGGLVVPAQKRESFLAIQPGDEPRRRTTERSTAVEQQQRPPRRRNIAEPRSIKHKAIHCVVQGIRRPYPAREGARQRPCELTRSRKTGYDVLSNTWFGRVLRWASGVRGCRVGACVRSATDRRELDAAMPRGPPPCSAPWSMHHGQVPTAGSGMTCSAGRTLRTVTTAITAPASRIAAPTCSARWYPGMNSAG